MAKSGSTELLSLFAREFARVVFHAAKASSLRASFAEHKATLIVRSRINSQPICEVDHPAILS